MLRRYLRWTAPGGLGGVLRCHLLCVRRLRGTCVKMVIGCRESFVWQKLISCMGGQTQILEQTICESTLNSVSGSCLMFHDDFCDDIRRSHDAVTLCVKKADETGTQPFMRTTLAKPLFTSWLLTVILLLDMEAMCSYGSNNHRAIHGIVIPVQIHISTSLEYVIGFGNIAYFKS